MKSINTIKGNVPVNELGFTLIHEHLLFQFEERFKDISINFARNEIKKFYDAGGKTLVDLTPFRNISWYKEIAMDIDVNVICCTGFYLENWVDKKTFELSEDKIIHIMEHEIIAGINNTNIKAGIIKVAADNIPLSEWEAKIFSAAAKTQVNTKTPIATHACRGAAEQQKILLRSGADPEHIFFSHVEAEFGWEGRNLKEEALYLLDIVNKGSYLLFNNFGFEFDTPEEDLIYILKFLADKGYIEKILISVDMNFQVNNEGKIILEAADVHPDCSQRVYSYLFSYVIPTLLKNGFSHEDINTIFVKNPQRFFNYL